MDDAGPEIDGNAAWCDVDNNAYFLWNAKFGYANQDTGFGKAYHGPQAASFPGANLQTLSPGNTAWGNVTVLDPCKSVSNKR